MPYRLERRGRKWCVVGPTRTHGCHDSRAEAIKQQRALYRNAPESAEAAAKITDWPMTLAEVAGLMSDLAIADLTEEEIEEGAAATLALAASEEKREPWSGILGIEMSPTSDGRIIELGTSERELPVPFSVQLESKEGHEGSRVCGRIETVMRIPLSEFDRKEDFDLDEVREGAVIIWGEGSLDGSEDSEHAKRLLGNGCGVSLDGLRYSGKLFDQDSLEEVDQEGMDFGEILELVMSGQYLRGVTGEIAGVTVVGIPAYKEAKVMVASASFQPQLQFVDASAAVDYLVAAAGPVKPPREWFENPNLGELTPLTITPEGRVYGHLADWDGCHIGFQGICMPPFRSYTDFAYFNTGVLETAEGDEVTCGKIMFCMEGNGHAPTHDNLGYDDVQRYYDDATKVGAFVRAGSDPFGTWLAGSLRPGLSEEEIQHLRLHPPSGDWRQIKGGPMELIAAFSVPVGGFPIPRRALVASADGEITAIISAPLQVNEDIGFRQRMRKRAMLIERLTSAVGPDLGSRAHIRRELLDS